MRKPKNRERFVELLKVYGELLADKQKLFASKHYVESLSFAEVARQHSISRQAVHDAVRHAEKMLEHYEATLKICAGGSRAGSQQVVERLEGLRRRVTQQSVMYSTDWIVKELSETLDMLAAPR